MAISKETTFVDAVTIVLAAWLNLVQEHLAGLVTLEVDTPTATQVRVLAGDDDDVAAVYIEGQQRFRDTNALFSFTSEPSATYGVYVTAPDGVDDFELEVTTGTPAEALYRLVANVDWNGAAITAVRMVRGRNVSHDHSLLDGTGPLDHGDLTGLTGDPHTQYMPADASRAFTGVQVGVSPTSDLHLATKSYVDASPNPGLPVGTILPYAGEDSGIPGGWYLCDGASYDTTAEATLFAIIAYAFGGAGANFNVPDFTAQRYALGKAAAGTGSTLGGTGGSYPHTHTQATHTHTEAAHTHSTPSHSHTTPTSGNGSGTHTHTQGVSGDAYYPGTGTNLHFHKGALHTHGGSAFSVNNSYGSTTGSQHASQATAGLYAEQDLDNSSSSTYHTHSDGTLTSPAWGDVWGTSGGQSKSHTHAPTGNAYAHTHGSGAVSGITQSNGYTNTSTEGSHTHTNVTTGIEAVHTHGGASTGSATPTMSSGGGGATSADGDDATGSADAPALVMHYIIRAS